MSTALPFSIHDTLTDLSKPVHGTLPKSIKDLARMNDFSAKECEPDIFRERSVELCLLHIEQLDSLSSQRWIS